jgi:Ner family transcriptional regulator
MQREWVMSASDWHREDVKAAVRKSGTTLVALALTNGFTETTVRKALDRPSPRAEAIIARQLGVTPQTIWPSRYDSAGNPVRGVRTNGRKRSRATARAKRQMRKAI